MSTREARLVAVISQPRAIFRNPITQANGLLLSIQAGARVNLSLHSSTSPLQAESQGQKQHPQTFSIDYASPAQPLGSWRGRSGMDKALRLREDGDGDVVGGNSKRDISYIGGEVYAGWEASGKGVMAFAMENAVEGATFLEDFGDAGVGKLYYYCVLWFSLSAEYVSDFVEARGQAMACMLV